MLIADDHPLVRDALARVLARLAPTVDVAEVADGPALFDRLAGEPFDLALVDLQMPGMNGLDGVRQLTRCHAGLPVIVVTGSDQPGLARAALEAGATGFVPKSGPAEELLQACRVVGAGGVYVPAHALLALHPVDQPVMPPVELTPRQAQVLALLMQGEPNKLIARQLGLTEGTVKLHIAALLRALRARNRTEATVRARQLGLPRR